VKVPPKGKQMSIQSKYVNGALVFHKAGNESCWVDAIGANVRKWEMRYGTDFTTACEYTVTAVNASTIAQGVIAGSRALITTAGADNDGINLQVIGTPFQLASGKPLYFGARYNVSVAALTDSFVGLASTDTALISASAMDVAASAVGLYGLSTTTIVAYNEIHADIVTTNTTKVRGTSAIDYEFFYDGAGTITYFVDGVEMAKHTTFIPTVVMTPSIVVQTGAVAAVTSNIEWMRCIQIS